MTSLWYIGTPRPDCQVEKWRNKPELGIVVPGLRRVPRAFIERGTRLIIETFKLSTNMA